MTFGGCWGLCRKTTVTSKSHVNPLTLSAPFPRWSYVSYLCDLHVREGSPVAPNCPRVLQAPHPTAPTLLHPKPLEFPSIEVPACPPQSPNLASSDALMVYGQRVSTFAACSWHTVGCSLWECLLWVSVNRYECLAYLARGVSSSQLESTVLAQACKTLVTDTLITGPHVKCPPTSHSALRCMLRLSDS